MRFYCGIAQLQHQTAITVYGLATIMKRHRILYFTNYFFLGSNHRNTGCHNRFLDYPSARTDTKNRVYNFLVRRIYRPPDTPWRCEAATGKQDEKSKHKHTYIKSDVRRKHDK